MPGSYVCGEEIFAGIRSIVYRATRDDVDVIIKELRESQLAPITIAQHRREFDFARRLSTIEGVVRIHELSEQRGALALVMDDGGRSLHQQLRMRRLELAEALAVTARVANTLGHIHASSVVHLDINPSNILVRGPELEVTIIDFGRALLNGDAPRSVPEGSLHYLAPEQTGRVGRSIDHRADLYSLGATMYELLTGAPPFVSEDPAELIHAHLARLPIAPQVVDPAIPEVVGRIVMKLLAKDPDDRYQSAFGVAADLEACQAALRTTGTIGEIEIGRLDLRHRLILSSVLYGREPSLEILLDGLTAVAAGSRRLQLVGGYAGVGKTCLIEELRWPVAERGGYFAGGKFDQLKDDIPYSAVAIALRQVVAMLLSEGTAAAASWRAKIGAALGADAGLVIELVPELAMLLDVKPDRGGGSRDLAHLVPRLLIKLIATLSTPAHPLVLFLDDLQWADPASLRLIESLMKAGDVTSLYLIGSYRDNEVTATHPLHALSQTLELDGVPVAILILKPLQLPTVVRLLGEALGQTTDEVFALAVVVVDKTQGNPFFVRAFMDALVDVNLVQFDATARRWCWDIVAIRERAVTANVVDLLIEKIDRLGVRGRETLILAACLGSELDLATLALVSELPVAQIADDLAQARDAGLLLNSRGIGGASDVHRFAHDRVQQAAYALIPAAERTEVHQKLGKRLLAATPEARRDAHLFELLHHLNFGMDGSPRVERVPGLLEMNQSAGKKARARAAHAAALHHFELAISLLYDRGGSVSEAWRDHHVLALELHDGAAEAAFLTGDIPRMEQLAKVIREHASSVAETVNSVRVRGAAMQAQQRLDDALDLYVETVNALGVNMPRRPGKLRVVRVLLATMLRMRGRSASSIAALPPMSDPHWRAVTYLIGDAGLTAYLGSQELFVTLSLALVDLSLRFGNSEVSALGYTWFAVLLCGLVGDTERGNEIADAVDQLLLSMDARYRIHRYGLAACVRPWKQHLRDQLPTFLQTMREAMEVGNHQIAALSGVLYCSGGYLVGRDLCEVVNDCAEYAVAIGRLRETNAARYLARTHQSALNLMGDGDRPWILIGDEFDEREAVAAADRSHQAGMFIEKLLLAMVFRQTEAGLTYRREAALRLDAIPGFFLVPSFHFFGALLELSACDGATAMRRRALVNSAQRSCDKLRKFARGAPMNFLHCARLVEAELHRVAGRQGESLDAYEEAIELARRHQYRPHEALANELAGRFHLQHGRGPAARLYLATARNVYLKWGATAKVRRLDDEFPELDVERPERSKGRPGVDSLEALGHRLDLGSVVKASQLLSSEVVLPKLVAQLMTLVAHNAGAERGFLISARDAGWEVDASYGAGLDAGGLPVPLETCQAFATSMVHYVVRTKEPLVVDDATRHGQFVNDPYVRRRQPRSVLVVPMLRQGELTGVLYLENNHNAGAFTPERVEVLGLLASQAAISIENAHLYEHLERKVAVRTAKLEQLQQVAVARYAGMAETATGVLHDVGNILNSIVVSSSALEQGLRSSRVGSMKKAMALIEHHADDLPRYLTSDPKGQALPRYVSMVADEIEAENKRSLAELAELRKRVAMIAEVIAAQQSSATGRPQLEKVELSKVVDDVLQILALGHGERPVEVVTHYEPIGRVSGYRTKLAHVVVNLVKNAAEAVAHQPAATRQITIRVGIGAGAQPYLSVRDTGMGISADNLKKMFQHGFTTKVTGHGFGLHACASSMEEMGGSIGVESDGIGHGAVFTLRFAAQG